MYDDAHKTLSVLFDEQYCRDNSEMPHCMVFYGVSGLNTHGIDDINELPENLGVIHLIVNQGAEEVTHADLALDGCSKTANGWVDRFMELQFDYTESRGRGLNAKEDTMFRLDC